MELAIKAVGENGKLQKITTFIVIASSALTLLLAVSFAYLTKQPEFLCRRVNALNLQFQHCDLAENICNSNFELEKDPERSVYNFSYSFDLFCSNAFYIPMLSTLYFFGGILGCVFLSSVPDTYGRQKLYKILMVISLVLHVNLLFAFGPIHLVVLHFLSGIASFAFGMSSVIVSEYIPRNIAGIIMSFTNAIYPFSGITIGLFFMFINNWRVLFFITTLVHVIVTYLTLKYFVESPRWLNCQKKTDECLATLGLIAEINGATKQWEYFKQNNQRKINKIFIFRSPSTRRFQKNNKYSKNIFIISDIKFQISKNEFFFKYNAMVFRGILFLWYNIELGAYGW